MSEYVVICHKVMSLLVNEVNRLENIKGIYQRNEGRWEARFKVGVNERGRAIYKSVYAKTKEEVIRKKQEYIGGLSDDKNKSTEMNLLILGAGTHGRDVYEIAESLHIFKKISFLDDKAEGEQIIGKCKDILKFRGEYPCAFVAIGDNEIRKKYANMLKEYHFLLPSIVSPMANISPNAKIGEGVAVLPMARIGDAGIGDFSIVASNGLVNTDPEVGAYSHVDSGAIVKKDAKVPEGTWIRSGVIYE